MHFWSPTSIYNESFDYLAFNPSTSINYIKSIIIYTLTSNQLNSCL